MFIRDYLLDEDNHFRDEPTSTAPLGERCWKRSSADWRIGSLALFAQHWPEEAAELAHRTAIEQGIDETAATLG